MTSINICRECKIWQVAVLPLSMLFLGLMVWRLMHSPGEPAEGEDAEFLPNEWKDRSAERPLTHRSQAQEPSCATSVRPNVRDVPAPVPLRARRELELVQMRPDGEPDSTADRDGRCRT